ncbi:MAG: hypothetical protein MRY83_08130 [Flavobacteriales bacterium]|nr:hypothetical protein [Flavobacteriales bacterium]
MSKLETAEDIRSELWILNYYTSEEGKEKAFRCIQKAQSLQNLELEFEARYAYIHQLVFLNYQEEAIAMFPWLLKMCDEHPGKFDYYNALWVYKWILGSIDLSSKVRLEQIEAILSDFEKRYTDYGSGQRVIDHYKIITKHNLRRTEGLYEDIQNYKKNKKSGSLDDCEACQTSGFIEMYIDLRKYEEALVMAKPIIEGKQTCGSVPEDTDPKLLHVCMMLGKWDLAEKFAISTAKSFTKKKQNFINAPYLLSYYLVTGKARKAKSLLQHQLSFLTPNISEYKRMYFFMVASDFIQSLIDSGKKKVKFKFKENTYLTEIMQPFGEETNLEAFQEWLEREANICASALDARNKNDFYQKDIAYRRTMFQKMRTSIEA